jgi:hypothetical protein
MTFFDKEMAEEARAIQFFTEVARQCGCTCTIDFENHTVNFEGPEHAKEMLIARLDRLLQ